MSYKTMDGIVYDLSRFSPEEIRLYEWLQGEAQEASSWTGFCERTSPGIIDAAKRAMGERWSEYPLFQIQSDLIGRVGIRLGELRKSD